MASFTQSGTGLKPGTSPSGLKIASSSFTAQPNEQVAAVDVYTVQSGGVINSIQEDVSGSGGWLSSIKNMLSKGFSSITGSLSNLTGGGLSGGLFGGGLSAMAGGSLGTLREGTSALRMITNTASRAMSAVNMVQKGGIMGTVGGLASLGSLGGIAGASTLASAARGTISGVSSGGITGYLRAGSSILGGQGSSLGQLAGNIGSITRSASYLQSAAKNGNFQSVLSGVDSSVYAASSTLSNLDRASQINFQAGLDSVTSKGALTSKGYNQSALGRVQTAVSDFTGGFGSDQAYSVPSRAGVTTGLAMTGAGLGNNSIYSQVSKAGIDNDSAFLAGTALTTHAAKTGNYSLLADIGSVGVGLSAISSNSNALASTVRNLTPSASQLKSASATVYTEIASFAQKTGQSWNSSTRNGSTTLDVSNVSESDYARRVVEARAAQDYLDSRKGSTQLPATTAVMTDAQALHIANQVSQMKGFGGKQKNDLTSLSGERDW